MVGRGCDMNDLQNVNVPLGFREEIRIKVHVQCDELRWRLKISLRDTLNSSHWKAMFVCSMSAQKKRRPKILEEGPYCGWTILSLIVQLTPIEVSINQERKLQARRRRATKKEENIQIPRRHTFISELSIAQFVLWDCEARRVITGNHSRRKLRILGKPFLHYNKKAAFPSS